MTDGRCAAIRQGAIDPSVVKQCPRRATHGEWCRQHAESLGGWRLVPPASGEPYITDRSMDWLAQRKEGYRLGHKDGYEVGFAAGVEAANRRGW